MIKIVPSIRHSLLIRANSFVQISNQVELETLMMAKQLSILVVGEDILKTNGKVCRFITQSSVSIPCSFLSLRPRFSFSSG